MGKLALGEIIVKRRKELRLSQEELGAMIPVTSSAVSRWETGVGIPSKKSLDKLSVILGIPLDYLYSVLDNSQANR